MEHNTAERNAAEHDPVTHNMTEQNTAEGAERPQYALSRPVFFVGFMGAGKTSVSRKLARMCRLSLVDMDVYLERREGKKIKDIFQESGEDGFRAIEADVLRELTASNPGLVSCGGGVVKLAENREVLKREGFVVYLRISADEAKLRIGDTSTRPLFQDIEGARALLAERDPLYTQVANLVVETSGKTIPRIANIVRKVLEEEGILWQLPA